MLKPPRSLTVNLYTNALVLTGEAEQPTVGCFAVGGGRFLACGERPDLERAFPHAEVVDLDGACVIPGLIDVHTHVARHALDRKTVECRDTVDPSANSIAELMRRMAERSAITPAGQFVIGTGADLQEERLAERRWPTRTDLDVAVPDHPAYIAFGSHVLAANSKALAYGKIDASTADPDNGHIDRDASTGQPTGVLYEGAFHPVFQVLSRLYTFDDLTDGLEDELRRCAARGVTCIHDMIKTKAEMHAFQRLRREGRLPIRASLLLWQLNDNNEFDTDMVPNIGLETGFGDDVLWYGGAKFAIDGAEDHSVYSTSIDGEPLAKYPTYLFDPDLLDDAVLKNHRAGIRVNVHAIGDEAVDRAIKAFERAGVGGSGIRHRIEHFGNWLCTPERLEACMRLGVTPIPNPPFLHFTGREIWNRLGGAEHYAHGAFPFKTLLKEGFRFSGASDGPGYYTIDGLRDLATMVGRRALDGTQFDVSESLTIEEALRVQTQHGAWLGYREDTLGSIAPGKNADFVVLDCDDLRRLEPEQIAVLGIRQTFVGGVPVYQGGTLPPS